MTRTTTPTVKKWAIDRITSAERMIRGYEEILQVARRNGMEYETERTIRSIAEWESEYEAALDNALEVGLDPDDLMVR